MDNDYTAQITDPNDESVVELEASSEAELEQRVEDHFDAIDDEVDELD